MALQGQKSGTDAGQSPSLCVCPPARLLGTRSPLAPKNGRSAHVSVGRQWGHRVRAASSATDSANFASRINVTPSTRQVRRALRDHGEAMPPVHRQALAGAEARLTDVGRRTLEHAPHCAKSQSVALRLALRNSGQFLPPDVLNSFEGVELVGVNMV